ncbi:MAG: hypothetical protein QM808_12260 [Steroidobacteraceae bacterium]
MPLVPRRGLFGALLLLAGGVLLVVAMFSRVRVLAYASYGLLAVGVWMIARRSAR